MTDKQEAEREVARRLDWEFDEKRILSHAAYEIHELAVSLAAENKKLRDALAEIWLWTDNADHPVCQGGHRPGCDCLRAKIRELAEVGKEPK